MKIPVNVPDGRSGDWRVQSFSVSAEEASNFNMRAAFQGDANAMIDPGDYKRLVHRGEVIMSNTPMEVRTNQPIINAARGIVLINGLGLGMVLTAILAKPAVESIIVVEKSPDVIALVGPTFAAERVTIIQADAYEYQPPAGMRFDCVWHDIWTETNPPARQQRALVDRYAKLAKWQGCWRGDGRRR